MTIHYVSKEASDKVVDELTHSIEKEFPFGMPIIPSGFTMELAYDAFGMKAVHEYNKHFTYDDAARWAYWNYPRFRTEADLVLCKLMTGK